MKTSTQPIAPDDGTTFHDAPDHPGVETLWQYWQSKCHDGRIPDRKDINLAEIAEIAPNLIIAERSDTPGDFRLRLVGSALSEITGEERTGHNLSEIGMSQGSEADMARARWIAVTSYVFETAQPTFVSVIGSRPGKEHLLYHAASLPLTNGGDEVDQILGCLFTSYRDQPTS